MARLAVKHVCRAAAHGTEPDGRLAMILWDAALERLAAPPASALGGNVGCVGAISLPHARLLALLFNTLPLRARRSVLARAVRLACELAERRGETTLKGPSSSSKDAPSTLEAPSIPEVPSTLEAGSSTLEALFCSWALVRYMVPYIVNLRDNQLMAYST